MSDFLETVISQTRARVASLSRERTLADLSASIARMPPVRSLRASLGQPGRRIIAEIKRASPSRGPLNPTADAAGTAARYERGGAAAISVLTEPEHFKGSLSDLRAVAKGAKIPVLRKDFLVDPWQAWEARAAGADAALLIAAALPGRALEEMASALAEAGLEALVEVHDAAELERALSAGFPVVGVNARNLRTLQVDRALVEALGPKIPRGVAGVAESGVKSPEDLAALELAGYHAFLVGEALITAKDPVALLQSWIGSVQ
jgi:indole-3-glycerol phosphate synthase